MFGYYSLDNYTENNPYPTAQGGANVPGFNALNTGRAQLAVLGDTKAFGSSAVNEFRLSYTRDANDLGKPQAVWASPPLRRALSPARGRWESFRLRLKARAWKT